MSSCEASDLPLSHLMAGLIGFTPSNWGSGDKKSIRADAYVQHVEIRGRFT